VITGSWDRTAKIWNVDYGALVDQVCERLPRDFTEEERDRFDLDASPTCDRFAEE
jgi:hypothetical protein